MTEDEMVGWHHRLNGHEFEQAPGVDDGCMKCSFGISDFLEEIPSLYHSVVFLYFFALIPDEGFLISSCYSLDGCSQLPNRLCMGSGPWPGVWGPLLY